METIVFYLNDAIFLQLNPIVREYISRGLYNNLDIKLTDMTNRIWRQNAQHIKQQLLINNQDFPL